MKKHNILKGLSILLIIASLLMLTGSWVTLKKEYRRDLSSVLRELDNAAVDDAEEMFYWYGLSGERSTKDLIRKIEKARDKAVDILEDGALSLSEGRYLLGKAASLMGDVKKMLKKADMWEYSKSEFQEVYGPLVRVKTVYTLFFAATIVLALVAGVLHLLNKKHSGIPAFLCFLVWTVAVLIAVGYLNKEAFYSDVLTISAIPVLAPLCMLVSVVLWKTGYKAYKQEDAAAPAPATGPSATAVTTGPVSPQQSKFCPNCGRAVPSGGAKFCSGCGKELPGASGGREAASQASTLKE